MCHIVVTIFQNSQTYLEDLEPGGVAPAPLPPAPPASQAWPRPALAEQSSTGAGGGTILTPIRWVDYLISWGASPYEWSTTSPAGRSVGYNFSWCTENKFGSFPFGAQKIMRIMRKGNITVRSSDPFPWHSRYIILLGLSWSDTGCSLNIVFFP